MFSKGSEDKNHLAMLAIPVILSMVFGFSGEVRAEEYVRTQTVEENTMYETEDGQIRTTSKTVGREERNRRSQKKRIEQTLIDNDYDTFLVEAKDTPFAEIMTKEAFEELVAQYTLRTSGYTPSSPRFYV